jgi:hypothetical protein
MFKRDPHAPHGGEIPDKPEMESPRAVPPKGGLASGGGLRRTAAP